MPYCEAILRDSSLLQRIKDAKFDVMIADYSDDCARILELHFNIPTLVYNSVGLLPLQNALFYPIIPSFVCSGVFCYTDKMTFRERVENFIQLVMGYFIIYPKCDNIFNDLKDKYGIAPDKSVREAFRDTIVIAHVTFALDYPRPLMPNVVTIPGLHTTVKPLPRDLQEFLDNSAPEGAIVMSFGSMVSSLSPEIALKFFNVFSRLRERVIWRYSGELQNYPDFPENLKLVGWFPQHDVLAHPMVKLFISHCGMTGTMEAMHHGLPILGFPLLGM